MTITLNNNLSTMKVGEYIWCKYTASSGVVGTFSEFATKTDAEVVGQEIPVASTATPNGYFRFIMVEDWNGKKRLVADRNIQHSISWDTLNTSGIASGSGLPLISLSEEPTVENGFNRKKYSVRLLTGGINNTDADNEWDRYIVNSNLGGAITSGDNTVWNWNVTGVYSWTSTTENSVSSVNRVRRGGQDDINKWNSAASSYTGTFGGFRPILEEYVSEFAELNKTLILHNDEYKNLKTKNTVSNDTLNAIPTMTSNTSPSGIVSASSETVGYEAWRLFDADEVSHWRNGSGTTFPHFIQYRFNEKKYIVEYSIKISSSTDYYPVMWKFEASNDGSTWITLDSQTGITNWSSLEEKSFSISNSNLYEYYRLNIIDGTATQRISSVSMKEKKVTQEVEWQTVSSTLPTVNQFVDEGMDSLTPVLNRAVQNLNPQEMTLDSTFVGEGKVYRKKVDLNRYFDLRTISTETRNE